MNDNPFIPGNWVKGHDFFGRKQIFKEILNPDGHRRAIWIIGTRRIGKTSLLKQLEYLTEKQPYCSQFISFFWDFQGCTDIKELNKKLIECIKDAEERFTAIGINCNELEGMEVADILNTLRRKTKQKKMNLLILCDETERLIRLCQNQPEKLLELKCCLQYGDNIKTIITSTIWLDAIYKSNIREIKTFPDGFSIEYLSRLNNEAAERLIRRGNFKDTQVKEIMEKTDNHPYLIQSVCFHLFNSGDLEAAIHEVCARENRSGSFEDDYRNLNQNEKAIIRNIFQNKYVSLKTLNKELALSSEEMDQLLYQLLKSGLIKQRNGNCSIGNYFFKQWLRQNITNIINITDYRIKPSSVKPLLPQTNIEKSSNGEDIIKYFNFFEEQKKRGQLHKFSHDGLIAVHEFKNEQGKIEKTKMGGLLDKVKNVSVSDCTVLITGETGTGKQLFAKLIHDWSNRSNGSFVQINCAEIPDHLIESELFGHTKGAFTDAKEEKAGMFEVAKGGTIFLDEIGELKYESQGILLRVIEEKKCKRIGATKEIEVDVRIIAATNKDLKDAIEKKEFREDLYARLNVFKIHIIPLSKRIIDIPFLVEHFRKNINKRENKERFLSREAIIAMMCYDWPYNVRQLSNIVERLIVNTTANVIDLSALSNEYVESNHESIENKILSAYNRIFGAGWQQIEKEVENEKERLIDVIKPLIEDNKIDEFFKSDQLKVQNKTYVDCYEYFKAYIDDRALSFPENERKWLAKKMIVKMWSELCDWRKKMGHRDVVSFLHPKLNTILGVDRKTKNNWEKKLKNMGKM